MPAINRIEREINVSGIFSHGEIRSRFQEIDRRLNVGDVVRVQLWFAIAGCGEKSDKD